MNKHIFKGKWHEISGRFKQRWGWLVANDMTRLKGNGEEMLGILQKHYGYGSVGMKKCLINLTKSASIRKVRYMAFKGQRALSHSIKANPVKSVILAASAGALVTQLINKKHR